MPKQDFKLTADYDHARLDSYISLKLTQSRTFVQEQIKQGRVLVNNQVATKLNKTVRKGDIITGSLIEEAPNVLQAVEKELSILHEDNDLLVLNKPQGWIVHPASSTKEDTLVHFLLHHLKTSEIVQEKNSLRAGIVHRLDRGTSGVLLVAKTRVSLEKLSGQFKNRTIKKVYEAITWGAVKEKGVIKSTIGRHQKDRKKMASLENEGRDATTHWELLKKYKNFSYVKLMPLTGRTHQLRVHLSENSTPIVGDKLYQKKSTPKLLLNCSQNIQKLLEENIYPFLHAKTLTFEHPSTKKTLTFSAPLPDNFSELLKLLNSEDL
jgi:23S rRNA pseudouridine1911/1915/1917 synthase